MNNNRDIKDRRSSTRRCYLAEALGSSLNTHRNQASLLYDQLLGPFVGGDNYTKILQNDIVGNSAGMAFHGDIRRSIPGRFLIVDILLELGQNKMQMAGERPRVRGSTTDVNFTMVVMQTTKLRNLDSFGEYRG